MEQGPQKLQGGTFGACLFAAFWTTRLHIPRTLLAASTAQFRTISLVAFKNLV